MACAEAGFVWVLPGPFVPVAGAVDGAGSTGGAVMAGGACAGFLWSECEQAASRNESKKATLMKNDFMQFSSGLKTPLCRPDGVRIQH